MRKKNEDLEVPKFLRAILDNENGKEEEKEEERMGKVKISIHFGKDLDEAKKEQISDIMEELGIKATDRKNYFEIGAFCYLSSTMEKYVEICNLFGDLAEITYEEIPPTPEELASEAASKSVPDAVKNYFKENGAELRGDDGKPGAPGSDGKDAPKWPWAACLIAVAILLIGSFFTIRSWRPVNVQRANAEFSEAANSAIGQINEAKVAATQNIEEMRVGTINEIAAGGVDVLEAIKKAGSVAILNPQGIKQPGTEAKPGTQTPPVIQTPTTPKPSADPLDAYR